MVDLLIGTSTTVLVTVNFLSLQTLLSHCLGGLAHNERSANGRNWLFTAAAATDGLDLKPSKHTVDTYVEASAMRDLLGMLAVSVDADKSAEADETACFSFRDTGEIVTVQVSVFLDFP